MQPITESPAMTIDHSKTAQLYWDTQDSGRRRSACGWVLLYHDMNSDMQQVEIDDDEEASVERLAYRVRREIGVDMLLSATWHIDVFGRGGAKLGRITIHPSKGRVSLRSELGWERA